MSADTIEAVTIRGTTYPSPMAVAEAFGMKLKNVKRAIRQGKADRIGMKPAHTRTKHGADPIPVMIRGRVFASAKLAAEHFGISTSTIAKQVELGRADFIGLGRSRKHVRESLRLAVTNGKALTIGSMSWRTRKAAARDLGVSACTIARRIKAGDTAWLMKIAMQAEARRIAADRAARDKAEAERLRSVAKTGARGKIRLNEAA